MAGRPEELNFVGQQAKDIGEAIDSMDATLKKVAKLSVLGIIAINEGDFITMIFPPEIQADPTSLKKL